MKVSKETREDLFMDMLVGGIGGGSPSDGVLLQESRGQQSLCSSESLPSNVNRTWPGSHNEHHKKLVADLDKSGIKCGAPYPDDSIFMPAKLPDGWKKVATDESMHSNLVDDKGRVRATIFYKASVHDRKASLNLKTRFTFEENYKLKGQIQYRVLDQGEPVFLTVPVQEPTSNGKKDWDKCNEIDGSARDACLAWLNENYPAWGEPSEYWD